jgi:hypothetical protein
MIKTNTILLQTIPYISCSINVMMDTFQHGIGSGLLFIFHKQNICNSISDTIKEMNNNE